MNRQFEDALAECLEAITQGQRNIDQCLALYPQWARRLEPLLRVAMSLGEAYAGEEPSAARQAEARQRFLAAARARQALALGPRRPLLPIPWPPRLPGPALRPALAALVLAVFAFVGFSSFTLATAGDALPGDWRYPVKRLTERARLTFVFGEDARRSFRIGLAEERLEEVEGLAAKEKHISEPILRELADNTGSLVEALDPASVPQDHIERIGELTAKQQDVLGQVEPLVEEEAADELEEAMVVSSEGHERAVQALALALARAEEETPEEAAGEVTPAAESIPSRTPASGALPSAEASPEPSPEPSPTVTGEASEEPMVSLEATPEPTVALEAPPEPTATEAPQGQEPTPTPSAPERQVIFLPDDTAAGITWSLMTIGDFSLRVPAGGETDWVVSNLTGSDDDERIFIGHRWSTRFDAIVVIRVSTGRASIHVLVEGTVQRVPADEVHSLVPSPIADVIFHVLESINTGP